MASVMTRLLMLLGVLGVVSALTAADPPIENLSVKPRQLDELPIPPGTIIVLRDPKDAVGTVQGVLLSPDEYRKLQETIDRLRKELTPSRPRIPSVCRLVGKVVSRGSQEVVTLRVNLEFSSSEGRSNWFLGFRRALIVKATLDGQETPELVDSAEGLTVVIDKPGRHTLTLELELPLQSRGPQAGERGLVVSLPGSPITLIERFELSPGVSALRLRPLAPAGSSSPAPATTIDARDLLREPGQPPSAALGPVEGVELTWDTPTASGPTEPLLAADGEIVVQVTDSHVETSALLQCRSLRGRRLEWRLLTPAAADVSVSGVAEPAPTITPTSADRSQWLIQSRQGEIESLKVEVRVRVTERPGKPLPIGPVQLVGALRQQGTIRLVGPNHLRIRTSRWRSDLSPMEISKDSSSAARGLVEFVQAGFNYGVTATAAPQEPWLYVDREPIQGETRVQVAHQLNLTDAGWRLTMDVRAVPIRTELNVLEIDVPPVLHPTIEVSPREIVEKLERVDSASNRWRIRLAHPRQVETTIRLEGLYPRPSSPTPLLRESASLILPRLHQVRERESRVTVTVPEGIDVSGTIREWDRDRATGSGVSLEVQPGQPSTLAAVVSRAAGVVDLTWAPHGAATSIPSTADVVFESHQARVWQRFQLGNASAKRMTLRRYGSAAIEPRLVSPGVLSPRGNAEWIVDGSPGANSESNVVLTWVQPIADVTGQVELSLLAPVTVGSVETRVRIWTNDGFGFQPVPSSSAWEVLPLEPVNDRPIWPCLHLMRSPSPGPLVVDLIEAAPLMPRALIERTLIQCFEADHQRMHCRAWYAIRNLAARFLDIELPEEWVLGSPVSIFLNGQQLDTAAVALLETSGRMLWRIPVPAVERLEMQLLYTVESRPTDWAFLGRRSRRLNPPRFHGPVFTEVVCWDVEIPGNAFALPLCSDGVLEQAWSLRRLMPTLKAARSPMELENWVRGLPGNESEPASTTEDSERHIVIRQTSDSSIELVLIPRRLWYLICSLTVLAAAVLLGRSRRLGGLFWLVIAAFVLVALGISMEWPDGTLLFLVGSPPGILAILLVALLQWWQRRQYQRRMIFLPAFERARASSTPSRPSSRLRPREIVSPSLGNTPSV
jgi:hypothetical protein